MDEKNNNHCDWFDHSSIWHYPCIVCGIWRGNPCCFVAGDFKDISYKYRHGISDCSHNYDCVLIYQLVYSLCVDLFANAHVYSTHLWVNALIMLLGVMLFAVGTGVYAAASLGRGSYEALTFSLAEKNGWQVKAVRMILDIVMVLTGVLLGGKFGICTIVTIIISGPVIQFTASKTKKLLKK